MTSITFCSAWNWTNISFPNLRGQKTQEEASQEIQASNYQIWVDTGCSSELKYLICSIYAPVCSFNVPITLQPCRKWCESVRLDCIASLEDAGYNWPEAFDCEAFPTDQPCFSVPDSYWGLEYHTYFLPVMLNSSSLLHMFLEHIVFLKIKLLYFTYIFLVSWWNKVNKYII